MTTQSATGCAVTGLLLIVAGCLGGPSTTVTEGADRQTRLTDATDEEKADASAFIHSLSESGAESMARVEAEMRAAGRWHERPAGSRLPADATHPTGNVLLHLQPRIGAWRDRAALIDECSDVRTAHDGDGPLDVVIVVSGVTELRALQVAVRHDPTVTLESWEPYAAEGSGLTIPSSGWPGNGAWIALTWFGGRTSVHGIHPIGRLRLGADSRGRIEVTAIPGMSAQMGAVQLEDRTGLVHRVNETGGLGAAIVGPGAGPAPDPCGDL